MCVVAFAWKTDPRWRLLLVGNRDEAHARAALPLARWRHDRGVIAGRDVEAGGTWMGVREPDRVAVVTNVRDPGAPRDGESRGLLVSDFLTGTMTAEARAAKLGRDGGRYRPFNLLLFDADSAAFVSNRGAAAATAITAGIHGLSNGAFDEPWPKVTRATAALQAWMAAGNGNFDALLDAFDDETRPADGELPHTGVGLELERRLAPMFIRGADYGTRATTVIAVAADGSGRVVERSYGPDGLRSGQREVVFEANAA